MYTVYIVWYKINKEINRALFNTLEDAKEFLLVIKPKLDHFENVYFFDIEEIHVKESAE